MRIDLDIALFGDGDTVKVRGQELPTVYRAELAIGGNTFQSINLQTGRNLTLVMQNQGSFTITVQQLAASDDSVVSSVAVRGGDDAVIPILPTVDEIKFVNSDSSSERVKLILF